MARRIHSDIIKEYQFLKKQVHKLKIKAKNSGPLQKSRIVRKITRLHQNLVKIEKECKAQGLPHPDAFGVEEPSLERMQDTVFGGPKIRSVMSPDGRLYGRDHLSPIDSPLPNKILTRLLPDGTLADKNAVPLGNGDLSQKALTKSSPDGVLFETPPLEGSFLPRRTDID